MEQLNGENNGNADAAGVTAALASGRQQNGVPCHPAFRRGDHIVTTASFDRQLHTGVVVDLRSAEGKDTEYFVHYDHWDKRTDEWVFQEKLQPYSEELASQCVLKRHNGDDEEGLKRITRRHRGRLEHNSSIKGDFASLDFNGKTQGKDGEDGHKHPLKARHTEVVSFGEHIMSAWYHSPLPDPFDKAPHLYVCPYSLKYFRKRKLLHRHLAALPPPARRPPGTRIYESPPAGRHYKLSTAERPTLTAACDPPVSVYEVDGAEHRLFCQSLCLLSKIFLDGKTLVWEVHEFLFYVLCEVAPDGEAMVGYFSREKRNEANHLACILTLPHKQRKGYGSLLIDFSYTLARLSEKPGSPERPLSDLGQQAFMEYWERELIQALLEMPPAGACDLATLAKRSGIATADIIEALAQPGCRFEELRIVAWKRTGYEVDVRSVEALQQVYALLTEGKHRLVVAPDHLDAAFRERLAPVHTSDYGRHRG